MQNLKQDITFCGSEMISTECFVVNYILVVSYGTKSYIGAN